MHPDLPDLQLRRAWLLAHAHGHEWAGALLAHKRLLKREVYPTPVMGYTIARIETITRAQRAEHALPGIAAPTLVENGLFPPYIEHVTGTGRLRWLVYADGAVTLDINRPHEGVVLRVAVAPDGALTLPIVGRYFRRHVAALEYALQALYGEDAAEACQALYEGAVDGCLSVEAGSLVDALAGAVRDLRNEGRLVQSCSPDPANLRLALSFLTDTPWYRPHGRGHHTAWDAARMREAIDRELAMTEGERLP